jgi:histidyl-tRNA synthetase
MKITKPKGTMDIYGDETYYWKYVEDKLSETAELYTYTEMRTPIFEETKLFNRGIGEGTDIVNKEMYTFEDKGRRSITLRPEGTAGVVRSYIENSIFANGKYHRFYYKGPMFRYEKPQAGRMRQFHQFGVEFF